MPRAVLQDSGPDEFHEVGIAAFLERCADFCGRSMREVTGKHCDAVDAMGGPCGHRFSAAPCDHSQAEVDTGQNKTAQ